MKQIAEDYCSFEVAKLLKEKGFDVPTMYFFSANGTARKFQQAHYIDDVAQPTTQMALKWLREVYNIHVEIRYMPDNFTDEPCYKAMIWDMNTEIGTPLSPNVSYTYFETCVEAALKYTLEKLI